MKYPLTKLILLEYALEGVRTLIGTHPCPEEYAREIDEYQDHRDILKRKIEKEKLRVSNPAIHGSNTTSSGESKKISED